MKKKLLALLVFVSLSAVFCLAGCSNSGKTPADKPAEGTTEGLVVEDVDEEPDFPGAAYGYTGEDPLELAVYKYMAEEVSKNYEKTDASIPLVNIVNVDYSNEEEPLVSGDFWLYNYMIERDTLKCVSGGNYPGVMHLVRDGEGYKVSSFDVAEDGNRFDESVKKLFGDHCDEFMKIYSDDAARAENRKTSVSDYVNMNGLKVTKFQDEGWDPVELDTN